MEAVAEADPAIDGSALEAVLQTQPIFLEEEEGAEIADCLAILPVEERALSHMDRVAPTGEAKKVYNLIDASPEGMTFDALVKKNRRATVELLDTLMASGHVFDVGIDTPRFVSVTHLPTYYIDLHLDESTLRRYVPPAHWYTLSGEFLYQRWADFVAAVCVCVHASPDILFVLCFFLVA